MNATFKLGNTPVFWCEHPEGMRLVGFADDVLPRSVKHRGWYLEDEGYSGHLARGVVYQLPGRDHKERFMYGVADPYNNGPAVLAREIVDDKQDAARWADHLAEIYAESERDFHRASDAKLRYDTLADEIAELRRLTLVLLAARRTTPNGAAIIPIGVRRLRSGIAKARKERAQLLRDFEGQAGFRD